MGDWGNFNKIISYKYVGRIKKNPESRNSWLEAIAFTRPKDANRASNYQKLIRPVAAGNS